MHEISKQEKEEVIKLLKQGYQRNQLALTYDIPLSTIQLWYNEIKATSANELQGEVAVIVPYDKIEMLSNRIISHFIDYIDKEITDREWMSIENSVLKNITEFSVDVIKTEMKRWKK